MKLATYHDGSRDGQLVVVSRDLTLAHYASGVASRMQQVLDDWSFLSPQLEDISQTLNHGKARHAFAFEPAKCMAPLPRAYQSVASAAFVANAERLQRTRGAELPEKFRTEPLLYRRDSDNLMGPRAEIVVADAGCSVDFEAGIAVITGDVAPGTSPEAAIDGIRLLMLANDVSLREPVPADPAASFDFGPDFGLGFVQSERATAFSPVAATPDEVLSAWRGGRVHLDLECGWNGQRVGPCDAAAQMTFHFGQLIAQLCRTRDVRAGTIIGSGAATTGLMRFGDTVRVEMKGADGMSVFGAIEQKVVAAA